MEGFLGPGHCEQPFSWISFYSCFLYLYELLQSPPFMCEQTTMLGVKVLTQLGHTASKSVKSNSSLPTSKFRASIFYYLVCLFL